MRGVFCRNKLDAEPHVEFAGKITVNRDFDLGVAEWPQVVEWTEEGDPHAKPAHRLPKLKRDQAHANDSHAGGQIPHLEHIVTDHHMVADGIERRRDEGRASGRDHDGARVHAGMVINLQ